MIMKVNVIMLFLVVASFFSCENEDKKLEFNDLKYSIWNATVSKGGVSTKMVIVFEKETIGYCVKKEGKEQTYFNYKLKGKTLSIDFHSDYGNVLYGNWLLVHDENYLKLMKDIGTSIEATLIMYKKRI